MSNKKIFKKLYSKKINKDDNYKTILKSIERDNIKMKKNIVKWVSVPACLIIVICGVVFLNKDNNDIIYKPSDPIISGEKNYEIYINTVTGNGASGALKLDADIKRLDIKIEELVKLPNYSFLKELKLPDDLNKKTYSEIYVKENRDSEEYTVKNNYSFVYENTKCYKTIVLAFSDKYKPLRDYLFDIENAKISKINNTEIIIYQYENSYMTTFRYNDINFDIETTDITEQEFIDLLVSIIK